MKDMKGVLRITFSCRISSNKLIDLWQCAVYQQANESGKLAKNVKTLVGIEKNTFNISDTYIIRSQP